MNRMLILFCFLNRYAISVNGVRECQGKTNPLIFVFSVKLDSIPEMVSRMKAELAMESDIRLKKDQKQGSLIQKLLKEVKYLKNRNHILESQFRNFVEEEQVSN